jgi:hypothetical protein
LEFTPAFRPHILLNVQSLFSCLRLSCIFRHRWMFFIYWQLSPKLKLHQHWWLFSVYLW